MRLVVVSLSVLALVALAAAPAGADVLKVPKEFASIQAAIDAAGPGDVVEVSKGVYLETLVISGRSDLVLRAKKGDKVIVDGAAAGTALLQVLNSDDVTVERLRFRNAGGVAAGVDVATCQRLRLLNCRVSNVEVGIDAADLTESELRGCRVSGTAGDGIVIAGAASKGCIVAENELTDIGDDGITVSGAMHLVQENEVLGADGDGILLGIVGEACSRTTARGNDVEGTGHGFVVYGGANEDCAVIDNTIRKVDKFGVYLDADRALIEGNRIVGAESGGMRLTAGSGSRILDNLVKKCDGTGLLFYAATTDAVLVGNRALKNTGDGFRVWGTGHCLMENVGHGNGLFDLTDESNDALYVANDFTTIAP